jgi:tetratricopeptide (TPR) repeat protein
MPESRSEERPTPFDVYYKNAMDLLGVDVAESIPSVHSYIDSIDDEGCRDRTFARVSQALASRGHLAFALSFCGAIGDKIDRADALLDVARALRRVGESESAREVLSQAAQAANDIDSSVDTVAAIHLQIAVELSELGARDEAQALLDRAIQLLEAVPRGFEESKTLAGCARLPAHWGQRSRAFEVAGLVESPGHRERILRELT